MHTQTSNHQLRPGYAAVFLPWRGAGKISDVLKIISIFKLDECKGASKEKFSHIAPAVCSWCGRVRKSYGEWEKIMGLKFTTDKTKAIVTHGMCPYCKRKQMLDIPSKAN
jgi:hypothetical protein